MSRGTEYFDPRTNTWEREDFLSNRNRITSDFEIPPSAEWHSLPATTAFKLRWADYLNLAFILVCVLLLSWRVVDPIFVLPFIVFFQAANLLEQFRRPRHFVPGFGLMEGEPSASQCVVEITYSKLSNNDEVYVQTWKDSGVLVILEDHLLFTGTGTSFVVGGQDIASFRSKEVGPGPRSSDGSSLVLRHPSRNIYLQVAIPTWNDQTPKIINEFQVNFDRFKRACRTYDGVRTYPPLTKPIL